MNIFRRALELLGAGGLSALSFACVVVALACTYMLIGELEDAGLARAAAFALGIWLSSTAARALRKMAEQLTVRPPD